MTPEYLRRPFWYYLCIRSGVSYRPGFPGGLLKEHGRPSEAIQAELRQCPRYRHPLARDLHIRWPLWRVRMRWLDRDRDQPQPNPPDPGDEMTPLAHDEPLLARAA